MRRGDVLTGPAVADLTGPPDFGPYRVGELVGQGGMGTVHRAYDTVNRRVVALNGSPAPGWTPSRRPVRREARVAAGLRHPHVVPVHAFGEIDGQLYLDMALIDGTDLRRLLGSEAVDPPRVLAVLDQIAAALDAAHAAGLVHRDVKPSNILLGPDDHAYLADFGIARSMSSESTDLTRSGALLGTLDYLAPERLSSAPIDGRADQYSLACVLYECLTGRLPHPTDEPAASSPGTCCDRRPPRRCWIRRWRPPSTRCCCGAWPRTPTGGSRPAPTCLRRPARRSPRTTAGGTRRPPRPTRSRPT